MAGEAPTSYRDPFYQQLAADAEQRNGLPAGLLHSIINFGERSNADQVSEKGARTVVQIIPETRKAAIKSYGIDPYLSAQNAIEVAAKLLKDSLDRNDGDTTAAIGEYIGGTNRKNWGPQTQAYIDRVSRGLQAIKSKTLGSDFAAWMAANPATPAATPAPTPAPQQAALGADFGKWLETKRMSGVDAIPGVQPQVEPEPDATVLDKARGAGEAALTTVTGMTGGAVGMVGGTAKGIVDSLADGTFGTQEGVKTAEKAAAEGAQALTYTPRTAEGQRQAAAVGDVLQQAIPVVPLTAELSAAAQAARNAAPAVTATAKLPPEIVKQKVQEAAARRAAAAGGEPTPGTMGSVGSAGTDMATLRRTDAQNLPQPIDLTKGQATRSFEQQRFEREMAKDPLKGEPLRNRFADQNDAILKNFDIWADSTGAELPDVLSVGEAVKNGLRERAARDKAKYRAAYKEAEKAGDMEAPVALDEAVRYLNENAPDAVVAPVLDAMKARALRLGVATAAEDGSLVPQPVPLKTAELFRRSINNATDAEPTNIRHAAQVKGLIDQATEGAGGELYQQARAMRRRFAENYEDIGLIRDLMGTKRGTSDAAIAAEDVFRRSMLNSSFQDLRQLRRILQTGGDEGKQAWRELQGAAVRWIKDEATKNVARNERGQQIVSPAALDAAMRKLDPKLEFIFGKKGAEQLRTVNELAKTVYTTPPGAVNMSNTASVILAALDMATSGVAGMPLPVMSGLRILTTHVRDRKIQRRIQEALGVTPEKKVKAPQSVVPPSAREPHPRIPHRSLRPR